MSTIRLSCCAHQRPIGQGGFYSATITLPEIDSYTLVYDCGSLTNKGRLNAEIEQFDSELANRPLDLLVLSHLDADHVNGVDALLTATGGVENVFLPYLSPLERLLCALRFPNQTESYLELLADPVAFLWEHGARHVYLVGGGDEGGDQITTNSIDPKPDLENKDLGEKSSRKLRLDVSKLKPNARVEEMYQSEDSNREDSRTVTRVSDENSINISGLWKLRFYQKEGLRMALENVSASKDFDKKRDDPNEERCRKFLKAVQKALGGVEITNASVLDAIRNSKKFAAVKAAYSKIASVHNEVSLCLWHGPTKSTDDEVSCRARGIDAVFAITGTPPYHRWEWNNVWSNYRRGGGTILTGDLRLKTTTLSKFKRHYADELPETAFLQLPHHGSRANVTLDSDLFNSGLIAFVSAGLRNRYLHPHLDLMEDLRDQHDLPVLWSHERRGVNFDIKVRR